MARYHFNIRNGHGFTSDDEGKELPSDEAARGQAILGARSLMSAEVLEGKLDLGGQIEVTNDEARSIMTVRFDEALQIQPAVQPETGQR